MSPKKNSSSSKICCFCNLSENNELEFGKFLEHNGISTHYYCLLLSSNMEQKGEDEDGILGFLIEDIKKEIRRGKRLICSYCKKIGATLGCCNPKCKRIFHFPCGLKSGSLHQFFGEFRSYCKNHRPKQAIDSHILEELSSIDNLLCYICYDKINLNDHINTLWAPCCKKDAWFHRECVKQLALSAGYFFRCPLCNNKKEFLKVMQEHGIFVPSQDASWELVPNAFEELLYRHDQCDAELCQCPKGRKYTSNNAKWELILCRTCGSQGIHMACGQLKWANPIWDCSECTSILCNAKKNVNENIKSNSSNSSSLKDSDLDSDTDISVGTEFPIPCSSLNFNLSRSSSSSSLSDVAEIKLRPGPRSFKLQQQIKAQLKESLKLNKCPDLKENEINYTINAENDNLLSKNDTVNKKSLVHKENISQQERKSSVSKINNEKSTQRKADHIEIMIKTDDNNVANVDDNDEVKIMSLKQDSTSLLQSLNKSLTNNINNINNSISKDSNATLINFPETSNIHQQEKPNESKTKSKYASVILEQSDTTLSRESMPNPLSFNNKKSNTDIVDIDESSIMNIKITNVTSLSPEVFESVPDVTYENITNNFAEESISSRKKIFKSCVRPLKRNIHEANNIASNSHKKNKGNNLGKNYLKKNSMKSCVTSLHMNTRQNRETSLIKSDEIHEDTPEDDPLQYTSDRIFNLPLDISQKKDSSIQSTLFKACEIDNSLLNIQKNDPSPSYFFKKNKKHTNKIKSRPSEESSTSYVQSSKENLMNKTTNTDSGIIKCSNQFPSINLDLYRNLSKPGSIINFTNTEDTKNNEAIVMHGEQTNIITWPQTINNTTMINNNQPTFTHHIPFCVSQTIDPIIFAGNNDQTGMLNNITLAKEKLIAPVLMSNSGHETSNKIFCDGDAGTSRAETKSCCRRKRRLPSECNRSIHINDDIDSQNLTTRNIFLQVTNNHNTCHQPRLIPQYMDLSDLKFRASESDNVQMILYDTFSVNIPVKNPKKSDKKSTNLASSKEYTLISRKQDEASCSIDYIAEQRIDKLHRSLMNENNLINDKIKYITHNCDDTKENLDPIKSKTLSCNDIFNNSTLMNDNDDITLTDYVCENNNEIRSSDTNLNTSKRICNTNIDNVADDTKLRNNCNQTSLNFVNFKDIDQVSSNTGSESREEKIANDRSFYKETNKTECNIDLDLNNTNKSIEKILQNNITFSMNKYIDDDKEIRHDTSDLILRNNEHLYIDNIKLRAQNQNITRTNMYSEHDVLNKQTDGRFIQCKMFRENIKNCNSKNNTKHKITKNTKSYESCFKISIDLCKIQNFIDTKPDLFRKKHNDDNNRKNINC